MSLKINLFLFFCFSLICVSQADTIVVQPFIDNNPLKQCQPNSPQYNNNILCPDLLSSIDYFTTTNSNNDTLELLLLDGLYTTVNGSSGVTIPSTIKNFIVNSYSIVVSQLSTSSVVLSPTNTSFTSYLFTTSTLKSSLYFINISNIELENSRSSLILIQNVIPTLNVYIDGCTFYNQTLAYYSIISLLEFYQGEYLYTIPLTISKSNFTKNNGKLVSALGTNVQLTNVNAVGNQGSANAIAIGVGYFLNINNCNFTSNSYLYSTVYHIGSQLEIDNSVFSNNNCQGQTNGVLSYMPSINVTSPVFKITSTQFHNNISPNGGAIYTKGYQNGNRIQASITNCKFNGNQANGLSGTGSGGALYLYYSLLNIVSTTFDSNSAAAYGGSVTMYNSLVTMDQCTIENSETFYGGLNYGGALYVQQSNLTLTNSVILNNIARFGENIYCTLSSISSVGSNFSSSSTIQTLGLNCDGDCTYIDQIENICPPTPSSSSTHHNSEDANKKRGKVIAIALGSTIGALFFIFILYILYRKYYVLPRQQHLNNHIRKPLL
ncbi:hypothetical protein CYY_008454 [Polysphondylium violaceum]|uniref:Pectin lyase-like family protein n=1 Tax=Polysphondylium violaceum TaxID=133409 RepID=A0A8J4PQE7_9MYCE|nr:hypothetical protein CYY_008454 [Polysphondylium violaceum]